MSGLRPCGIPLAPAEKGDGPPRRRARTLLGLRVEGASARRRALRAQADAASLALAAKRGRFRAAIHPPLPAFEPRRYLFPKGDPEFYARVGAALGLMVTGKLLNISVPFLFKHAGALGICVTRREGLAADLLAAVLSRRHLHDLCTTAFPGMPAMRCCHNDGSSRNLLSTSVSPLLLFPLLCRLFRHRLTARLARATSSFSPNSRPSASPPQLTR